MDDRNHDLPRICIYNPNTSALVSRILACAARQVAAGRAAIEVRTAPFGATALETPADLECARKAIARMVSTETWADAIIIGAFGDPGLDHVFRHSPRPVTGIGKAGLLAAARQGKFEILTLGTKLRQGILAQAHDYGVADRLTGLHFLKDSVLDIANHPDQCRPAILQAARDARTRGASCLLLGGAPFSGMGRGPDMTTGIPILDGTSMAIEESLMAMAARSKAKRAAHSIG